MFPLSNARFRKSIKRAYESDVLESLCISKDAGGYSFDLSTRYGDQSYATADAAVAALDAFMLVADKSDGAGQVEKASSRAPQLSGTRQVGQIDITRQIGGLSPYATSALELVIDRFGRHEEIWLSNVIPCISPDARTAGKTPQSFVDEWQKHGVGKVEPRPGDPHDFSVLILDEDHDAVRRLREETDVYISRSPR